MATHIIMLYPPQGNDGLEDLFSFLSACSDADLRSALEEAEGSCNDDNEECWQHASEDFHARILEDAYAELNMAREELMLAQAQLEQVTHDIENLQVLEDMYKHARRVHDNTEEKMARIEKLIKFTEEGDETEEADKELLQKAISLKQRLETRLAQWSEDFASELEANFQKAEKKFKARGITLDEAMRAVDDANQAVADAEELIKNLQ